MNSNCLVLSFFAVPNTILDGVIEIEEFGVFPERGILNNAVSELFRKHSVSINDPNFTGLKKIVIIAVSLFVA